MDAFPLFEVTGVIVCILLSAYFSGTETALTALSEAKSEIMEDKYPFIAPVLKKWKKNPGLILSSLLVGNNVVNIFGALLAGKTASFALASYGQAVADVAAVAGMTLFVLIFGEVTPKTFAKLMPERWLFPTLIVFRIFEWILMPFAIVLSKFASAVVKFMGGESEYSEMTQNEIEYMIQKGSDRGVFEQEEQGELLTSVIEFKDTLVKEIMTPRTDSNFLEVDTTIAQAMEKIEEWGHSRIPVYEDSVDNIKGILYVKDLAMLITKDKSVLDDKIITVARPGVFYVPETQKIHDTLAKMRAEGNHLGIVVDEFGGTSGIITLEDVLEELVGDIRDENDKDEKQFEKIEENVILVDAHITISDLEEELDIKIPDDGEYTSLGGFIVSEAGEVPRTGFVMNYENYEFKVVESNEKNILKVEIRILDKENEPEESESSK
ncbi:HlyC/CorC family transporter [bacterium]|nr:HlyC/CorC family transporter [bacterium]